MNEWLPSVDNESSIQVRVNFISSMPPTFGAPPSQRYLYRVVSSCRTIVHLVHAGVPMDNAKAAEKPVTGTDLEVKDAQLIFAAIWDDLVQKHGRDNLRFPREFIWDWRRRSCFIGRSPTRTNRATHAVIGRRG